MMLKTFSLYRRILMGVLLIAPVAALATDVAGSTPAPWRAKVQHFAAEHFKHPAWGYSHSERDYKLARKLAAEDNVALDDDVLFAAAYLHDIAAFSPWEKPDKDHQDVAVEVVPDILREPVFRWKNWRRSNRPFAPTCTSATRKIRKHSICMMRTRSTGSAPSGSRGSLRSWTRMAVILTGRRSSRCAGQSQEGARPNPFPRRQGDDAGSPRCAEVIPR